MKDLSHLGKIDQSTLDYAQQLEQQKHWSERTDLHLRNMLYTQGGKYELKENVNVESEFVLS